MGKVMNLFDRLGNQLELQRARTPWTTAAELLRVARRFDGERQPFLKPQASSLKPQS
jgi:hypothetical protein